MTAHQNIEKRPVGRPAKVLTLVPNRSITERAAKINEYHNSAAAAYAQASYYAVLCGLELLAAKSSLAHGEWLPWIEKHCEFRYDAAYKYMCLAERAMPVIRSRYPELAGEAVPMAPSLMKAEARKQLVAAVSEMTDQRTIQELQLELGIVKPREHGLPGGANNPYGRAGNPATILDRAEAERLKAIKDWTDVCRIALGACQVKSYGHLEPLKLQQVWETVRSVADELEHYLKTK